MLQEIGESSVWVIGVMNHPDTDHDVELATKVQRSDIALTEGDVAQFFVATLGEFRGVQVDRDDRSPGRVGDGRVRARTR